ncbi:uncharacterized protein PG986_003724 [Apiospora aurea]|uniref:Uncharacterized protein n=1 Tax=Apiospora aurea TaxID=335848 RepID=A0ABR1QSI6_9PEZI
MNEFRKRLYDGIKLGLGYVFAREERTSRQLVQEPDGELGAVAEQNRRPFRIDLEQRDEQRARRRPQPDELHVVLQLHLLVQAHLRDLHRPRLAGLGLPLVVQVDDPHVVLDSDFPLRLDGRPLDQGVGAGPRRGAAPDDEDDVVLGPLGGCERVVLDLVPRLRREKKGL